MNIIRVFLPKLVLGKVNIEILKTYLDSSCDSERDNVAEFRELIEAFFEARNVPELPVLMPCPISSSSL